MRGVLVKFGYCVEDRQARARSTLGVVVVRLGLAEVGHHAVAKVLRDMPAEALDCLRRRAMVLADDLAPLLGIEMAGDLGRADEIAETAPSDAAARRLERRAGSDLRHGSARQRRWLERSAPHCAQNFLPGWVLETALLTSVAGRESRTECRTSRPGIFR